jgi:hypothetical protein
MLRPLGSLRSPGALGEADPSAGRRPFEAQAGVEPRPKRTAIVPVRLTEGERSQLGEAARDTGLTLSTYIRDIVFDRPLPVRRSAPPVPEINRKTYGDLARATGNLNQLTRALNRGDTPEVRELVAVLEALGQAIGTVRLEVLGLGHPPEEEE